MVKFRDNERYPNQPLVDVACELRFPGEMEVECGRDRLWERIRDQYPEILVPSAKEGQPLALQHYRFRTADRKRTVALALNSLAYSEREYRGHKEFIAEFVRIVGEFRKCFKHVDRLNRVGWRYMNVIPFAREQGIIPVKQLLKFEVKEPSALFKHVSNLDLRFESRQKAGVAIVRLAGVTRNDQSGGEALLLDLDFGKDSDKLRLRDAERHVSEARTFCRRMFEQMITKKYRDYLRGSVL